MLRSTLLLMLIIASAACAGRARMPDPPAIERCLTLPDHLRCRGADGSHYSEPYPGKRRRECTPIEDAEALRDVEALAR